MNPLERRLLWWRYSWWFQWAHKPLCEAYHEDVLRVGRMRLCRGCSALWAGLALGCGAVLLLRPATQQLALAFLALAPLSIGLSHPAVYTRWGRRQRDLLRMLGGSLPACALGLLLIGEVVLAGLVAALLASAYLALARARRSRRLTRCESCPELGDGICSGYALQAEAVRSWEQAAAERVARRGFPG